MSPLRTFAAKSANPPCTKRSNRSAGAKERLQAPGLRQTEPPSKGKTGKSKGGDRLASVPLTHSRLEPKWLSLSLSLCFGGRA